MNIVIPMAGIGSRFVTAGYRMPKPLIPVFDRPMYAWAVDSLPLERVSRLIFICLAASPYYDELRQDIEKRYAAHRPTVISLGTPTEGQSVTVLAARDYIYSDEPLLIHNSDTAFRVTSDWCDRALSEGLDGALLVFESNEQRWSYAREEGGLVVEVREKVVISRWATAGTYWFRHGHDFVRLASRHIAVGTKESGEYFVGPLYNDLIREGGRVKNFPIDELYCFGTPEDYVRTLVQLRRAHQGTCQRGFRVRSP